MARPRSLCARSRAADDPDGQAAEAGDLGGAEEDVDTFLALDDALEGALGRPVQICAALTRSAEGSGIDLDEKAAMRSAIAPKSPDVAFWGLREAAGAGGAEDHLGGSFHRGRQRLEDRYGLTTLSSRVDRLLPLCQ